MRTVLSPVNVRLAIWGRRNTVTPAPSRGPAPARLCYLEFVALFSHFRKVSGENMPALQLRVLARSEADEALCGEAACPHLTAPSLLLPSLPLLSLLPQWEESSYFYIQFSFLFVLDFQACRKAKRMFHCISTYLSPRSPVFNIQKSSAS